MAKEWWQADPIVQSTAPQGANWWDADPIVGQKPAQDPSLLDRAKQGLQSTVAAGQIAATNDPAEVARLVAEEQRTRLPATATQRKMAAEVKPLQDAYEKATGLDAVGAFASLAAKRLAQFVSNPSELAGSVVENLPNSAPGMAGGLAGGAAGGSVGGLPGAVVGGVAGGTVGGYFVEQGAAMRDQILQAAQEKGIDPRDAKALEPLVREQYQDFLEKSRLKGIGTAGTDAVLNAVTFGVAGIGERTLAKEARALTEGAKAGTIGAADAATSLAALEARQAARTTIPARAVRGAGIVGAEMLGEGVSEAAGQQLAYGKVNPLDVIDESILGLGQGAGMAAGRSIYNRATGQPTIGTVEQSIEAARAEISRQRQAQAQQDLGAATSAGDAAAAADALAGSVDELTAAVDDYLRGQQPAAPSPVERPTIEQLRARADREAELLAQADNAGFAFDRDQALQQIEALRQPGRERTLGDFADLTPMDERQARNRLVVLREQVANEGGNALGLSIVPHPTQADRFAIKTQPLPSLDLNTEASVAAPVTQEEANARLDAAAFEGATAARRAEDAPRQGMIARAMSNIEQRGGVASPYEADVLREANMGRPYDRVNPALAPTKSEEELLTEATGIVVPRSPRESQVVNAPPAPFQYTPEVQGQRREAAPEVTLPQAAAAPQPAEQARLERAAAEAPAISNEGVQVAEGFRPRQDFPGRREALVETGSAPVTQQDLRENATGRLSTLTAAAPETVAPLENITAQPQVDEVTQRLQTAAANPRVSRFEQDMNPQVRIERAANDGRLATQTGGRIITSGAKLSTQRSLVPGSSVTINDAGTEHKLDVVDASRLGVQGRLLQQIARIFGKRVVAFQSGTLQADGFVMNDDNRSVFLNVNSQISPLAVFGHELTHLLKRDNPEAYAALEAVVEREMGEGAMAKFEQEYGQGADIEELTSDLMGDRFQEADFWQAVFDEIAAQNPEGARGIINRLVAAITRAVNAFVKVVRQPGFQADRFVKDAEAVRRAATQALAQYAQSQRGTAAQLDAAPQTDSTVTEGGDVTLSQPRIGINVASDGNNRYADLIVDGQKTYETRNVDSLRPYVGKRVAVVRTGEGQARAIGAVTVGEPIVVDEQRFRELQDQHLVPPGSKFDIQPGGKKYLYPLSEPERFGADRGVGRGIVARRVDDIKPSRQRLIDTASLENALKLALSRAWPKGRDLKVAIQQQVLDAAAAAGIDVTQDTPQARAYLLDVGIKDALAALQQNPNAIGWYDLKTRQALAVMALVHPEIATNEEARFAFTWALAVTSNGQKVDKNFELAEAAYETYKRTGNMPSNLQAGQAQKAINDGLELFNELRDAWGMDNLRKFMQTNFTVSEITGIAKRLKPGGEHADVTVVGAAILGPKIGNGFFSNLYGNFDALTMDRWLIRTWGRWTGTLIKAMPELTDKARDRLKAVIDRLQDNRAEAARLSGLVDFSLDADVDVDQLSRAVQEASMVPATREQLNQSELGLELRKAGNSLAKYLDGQKEAPSGPTERKFIRAIFQDILSELKKTDAYKDLTMADLQAVLWYAEKRLYETAKENPQELAADEDVEGYADDEAPDYANAAAAVARQKGVSDRRVNAALRRIENERSVGSRSTNQQGSQVGQAAGAGQQGTARGFTRQEKQRFIGERAVLRARADRAGDAQQPGSYSGDGRADGGRVRVLKSLGVTYTQRWKIGRSAGTVFRANNLPAPEFVELASTPQNAQRFYDAIAANKAALRFGAAVSVYTTDQYQDMRLFLSEDGKSGVAVKPDGDIVSVFSTGGAGRAVLELAVAAGGRKLDAFDTILPEFYAPHGFKAVARTRWNNEYAPDGWNKATFSEFNNGEPDVVFMVYDPAKMDAEYTKRDGRVMQGEDGYDRAVAAQSREMRKIQRANPVAQLSRQRDVLARVPELEQAAQGLKQGTVTREQYEELVNALKPVTPYAEVPKPATVADMRGALTSDKVDRIGVPSKELKAGDPVGLRLDIPAYANHGVWVVSVHDQKPGFAAGTSIGYESVAAVTNPTFGVVENAALNIAGGKPKATIAVMKGDWKPVTEKQAIATAKMAMKSGNWVQVGMDPTRHAYFYDRSNMEPVVSADEAVQIGPLVLAKNPVYGKKSDFKFSRQRRNTEVPDEDVFMEYSRPAENRLDAERAWSDGDYIFAVSEMDEQPSPVTSMKMLNSYTPDQLLIISAEDWSPEGGEGRFSRQRGEQIEFALTRTPESRLKPLEGSLTQQNVKDLLAMPDGIEVKMADLPLGVRNEVARVNADINPDETLIVRQRDGGRNRVDLERPYKSLFNPTAETQPRLVLKAAPEDNPEFKTGEPVTVRGFHGSTTGGAIAEEGFNPEKRGNYTGAASAKMGFFFAGKPSTANEYTGVNDSVTSLFQRLTTDEQDAVLKKAMDPERLWPLFEAEGYTLERDSGDDTHPWALRYGDEEIDFFKTSSAAKDYMAEQSDVDLVAENLYDNNAETEDLYRKAFGRDYKQGEPVMYPVRVTFNNPLVYDFGGKHQRDETYASVIARAKREGYDGVILTNTFDPGPEKDNIFVVFEPEQIEQTLFSRRRNILGQPAPLASWTAPTDSKMDNAIYVMQDKLVDTKRVVQAIKDAAGAIDDKWNPYLREELFHGRTAKQTSDFLSDELQPMLEDLQRRGIEIADFEEYLHNRHAEERNDQIAKVNPSMPDGGSGIDTADARAYLAGLDPSRRQSLEAVAQRVDAITKGTRDLLVSSGLETADTIANWENAYSKYVPLQREDLDFSADTGMGTGQGYQVRGPASRRATGSSKPVVDILANVAMQRERAIVRAEKAQVARAVYGLAVSNPNTDFWLAVDPAGQKDPAKAMADLQRMGINPIDAQNIIEEPTQSYLDPRTGLVTQRVNPLLRSSPNVLAVRVNGEEKYVFFNPSDERAQRMVSALKNLDADQLGRIMAASATVARYIASVNTQYNPIFGAVNFLKDTQGAMFNLTTTPLAKDQAAVAGNVAAALRGIYSELRSQRAGRGAATGTWATLYREFQNVGGQTGYRDMFSRSEERGRAIEREFRRIAEGKAKQFGRAVFDWLSDYNTTMENAVRLSAYKVALDKGLSKDQAASIAKNLTVNFNRKGQVATQAGALYAFFNASVQGSARLAETLRGPAGKKIMAGGLVLGAAQAMLLAAAGFDDDEPPDFQRERNIIIPIGGKKYVAIPMPLGFHVIPNTSRVLTEWMLSGWKDSAKRVGQITGAFLDAFNPIGNAGWSLQTIAPTSVDWLAALAENKDWTGKSIALKDRSDLSPTPGYTRTKETATWLSKQIAYYLNLATGGTKYKQGLLSPTPDQIDYLAAFATGGVGREVMKAEQLARSAVTGEELPPYKLPLLGRVYGDAESKAAESNRFYENLRRLNEHEAEIKGRRQNREDVAEYRRENPETKLIMMANATERDVQQLRKRRRDMLDKGASKESIKIMEERIAARMKRFNDRVREVSQQP